MAKEKKTLSGDRDLGTVAKRLASGMFETSKKEKIPPFPGVVIGSKIRLVNSQFEIVGGKEEKSVSAVDVKNSEIKELKARIEVLEGLAGEKGSTSKTPAPQTAKTTEGTTPPKVGE